MNSIKQAVIPAAGLGSRFLPCTKSVPKELIPLVDRPCLDHVVDEAIAAGVEKFVLVLSENKTIILDYYAENPKLIQTLAERSQEALLAEVKSLSTKAEFDVVFQNQPLGLGHAVACAKEKITDDWFFVLLPDDIIDAKVPVCLQMLKAFQENPKPLVSVMTVPWDQVHKYGIVKGQALTDHRGRLQQIVEKPTREEAPSNLAVVGRYILPKTLFSVLENLPEGTGGEIQLTDALGALIAGEGLDSCVFQGAWYDTGYPLGWLKANIAMALKDEKYSDELSKFLKWASAGM